MASRLDSVDDWDKLAARARFRVTRLAKDCDVSERQLRRFFKKNFGQSPRKWLAAKRLGKVRALLVTGKSIKEVAAQAGFHHQSNFARSFKHYYNATPSSQRRAV
jgi:transcriptional regulator GlxA family with amidase domain